MILLYLGSLLTAGGYLETEIYSRLIYSVFGENIYTSVFSNETTLLFHCENARLSMSMAFPMNYQKLHLDLDALRNQKILKGIY